MDRLAFFRNIEVKIHPFSGNQEYNKTMHLNDL